MSALPSNLKFEEMLQLICTVEKTHTWQKCQKDFLVNLRQQLVAKVGIVHARVTPCNCMLIMYFGALCLNNIFIGVL